MLSKKLLGLAAVVPTVLLGGAAVASAAAGGVGAKSCAVSVDRSQIAGTYSVTRQVMRNGDCMCYVYASPKGSAGVERAIASVMQTRKCGSVAGLADAAASQDAGTAPAEPMAEEASSGGMSHGAAIGLGLVGAAAVAGGIIVATDSDDSKGG